MNEPHKDRNPGAGIGLSLAYTMIGAVVVLTLGGVWLDRKRGGGFVFTITGMVIAVAYIVYELWKLNRMVYGEPDKENDDETEQRTDS